MIQQTETTWVEARESFNFVVHKNRETVTRFTCRGQAPCLGPESYDGQRSGTRRALTETGREQLSEIVGSGPVRQSNSVLPAARASGYLKGHSRQTVEKPAQKHDLLDHVEPHAKRVDLPEDMEIV